jgi:hypothetical protein
MNDLELIQSALPAEDGPSDASWVRARAQLMDALVEDGALPRRRLRVGRLKLMPTLGIGGLAIAVLAGLVIASVIRGGAVRPATATAAAVLQRAAAAALASPPARLGPGQWWYSENVSTYLDYAQTSHGSLSAYMSETERYWIGDGRWIRREQLHDVRAAEPITQPWQKVVMRTFGPNPSLDEHNDQFDLPVSYSQLLRAPLETAALSRFVLAAETPRGFQIAPQNRVFVMVNAIHDILIEPMVPSRLRAALFRVAATIPGAQLLGRVRDHLGRTAIAIGFAVPRQNSEYEFLFAPRSYALLDDREVNLKHPRVIEANTAFVTSALVDRPGAIPSHSDH